MVYCMAEHLKAGAEAVNIWLRNILNAVVELEVISEVLHELRGVLLSLHTKLWVVLTATWASPSLPWL